MAKDERVERLRTVPLFQSCTDPQLQFIATRVEDLDFPAGKVLCEEGASGGDFFIVLSGEAEVRRSGKKVDTMREGDFFGEISLIDNGPRTATVVAAMPMRCFVLSAGQFQDVLYQSGEIARQILYTVTKRLRGAAACPHD